jgi:hypothetical protein
VPEITTMRIDIHSRGVLVSQATANHFGERNRATDGWELRPEITALTNGIVSRAERWLSGDRRLYDEEKLVDHHELHASRSRRQAADVPR